MAQEMGPKAWKYLWCNYYEEYVEVKKQKKNTRQSCSTTKHIVTHNEYMGQDMNYDSDKKEEDRTNSHKCLANDIECRWYSA